MSTRGGGGGGRGKMSTVKCLRGGREGAKYLPGVLESDSACMHEYTGLVRARAAYFSSGWWQKSLTSAKRGERGRRLIPHRPLLRVLVVFWRRQVDFGDLCMMATDLFVRHPEVLER